MTEVELVAVIDHTLLKPEATPEQVDRFCDQAAEYGFGAVCVNPIYVRRVTRRLESMRSGGGERDRPRVVSVVGFPLGAVTAASKVEETRRALDEGAVEIDMVVALGALIAGDRVAVRNDIEAVAGVVHRTAGGLLKVILEVAALTEAQIALGCRCCAEGEADFVKTSTGFHAAGGATVAHVARLVRLASPIRVKAAGGIRTLADARAMLDAGAARIGTSSGVAMVEALRGAGA